MSHKKKTNILIGICGGIAIYKICEIASYYYQKNYSVNVVMTRSATRLVSPLLFESLTKNPVCVDIFNENTSSQKSYIRHINLADKSDIFLIAPATANTIAKLANGIADNALTSIALASKAKFVIAPAMNGKMWKNKFTQKNINRLQNNNYSIISPEKGMLSCGYKGIGRLAKVEKIIKKLNKSIKHI